MHVLQVECDLGREVPGAVPGDDLLAHIDQFDVADSVVVLVVLNGLGADAG